MDYASINKYRLGAKTEVAKKEFKEWIVDGQFLPFSSDKYIYHHSNHANCSNVNFLIVEYAIR